MLLKNSLIKTLIVLAIGSFLFILNGCQQALDMSNLNSAMVTPEGVKAEQFLPEDAMMVFKLGTTDVAQKANLLALSKKFPSDGFETVMKELSASFNEEFDAQGLTFEKDLLPAIGDNAQIMLSISGDLNYETDSDPDVLFVVTLADVEKFEGWMSKSVDEGDGKQQTYNEFTIYSSPDNESFIVPHKDVFIVSNSLRYLKSSLDRYSSGGSNLLTNVNYQECLEKVSNVLGFMYMDPEFLFNQMMNDPTMKEQMGDEFMNSEVMDMMEVIDCQVFSFMAEKDGIKLNGYVFGDEEKWKEYEEMFNVNIDPAYLYKSVPGDGMIMFAESSNLKLSVEMLLEMYSFIEGFNEGVEQMRSALKPKGIDFDEDVLGMMDKGYAVSLQDSGSIIPSFGIYVDASSKPESAKKIMSIINESLNSLLLEVPEDSSEVLSNTASDKEENVYSFIIDFGKLSEDQKVGMPEDFVDMVIEFHYGVNSDNLAYFVLYPGFDKGGYSVLADDPDFKKAYAHIEGYDRSLSYIDVEAAMTYVDRFVEFGARMDGGDAEDMADYQLVKTYISPIKSLVFSAKSSEVGYAESQGFILIEGDAVPDLDDIVEVDNEKASCIASCEVQAVGKEVVDECIAKCI